MTGGATTTVDGGAQIGQTGTVNSLTVSSSDTNTAEAHTVAVSAGIGAFTANFASSTVNSQSTASIGNGAKVAVTAGVTVSATATPATSSRVDGVSVGVAAGLGASDATATTAENVTASIGNSVIIGATLLSVTATLSPPPGTNTKNAYADALAGGGGILVGVQGAAANATTNGTVVSASVGNNVSLPHGDVTITSKSTSQTQSDATGIGIGFVGIGLAVANATSDVQTSTSLGSGTNTDSSRTGVLTIQSNGKATTVAASTAGSGGVVAGNASEAHTTDNSTSTTSVGQTSHTLYASGVTISSENEADYFTHSDSTNAAVVGASGAFATFNGNSSATTTLPNNLTIDATGVVKISSRNNFITATGGSVGEALDNVDAAGGGGITATAASSTTTITGNSKVNIGSNLNISAINEPETNNASIGIDAGSEILSNDFIKLETGGLINGAGVWSTLNGTLDSEVNIGTGANLYSTQDAGVGTYTIVVGDLEANASTWGAAAVGSADAHLNVTTTEKINVGSGSQFFGLGNVNVRTGDSSDDSYSTSLTGNTSAQSYVRGVIAVPEASASTYFTSDQETTLSGVTIDSGMDTTIGADPHNPTATADGTGHGYELGFIPLDDGSSDSHANTTANVSFSGTVVAGFYHELDLTIANTGDASDSNGDTGFSGADAVTQNKNSAPVSVTYDPAFNPRDFVNSAPGGDATNNALLVPYLQEGTVGAIHLGNLYAAGGNVIIDAKSLTGSGRLEAHGGPTITVLNQSKDYLVIDGTITIPDTSGGHVDLTGGATAPGGLQVSENNKDVGGTVTIHNSYGGTYGSPPSGPGIIIAGATANLSGLVSLIDDEGSIIVTNSMYAANISISAPNGAFAISFSGTAVLGSAPMSEWQNVIVYPGGNPATTVGGINALNANSNTAIAYVANSKYPYAPSETEQQYMYALLGNSSNSTTGAGLVSDPAEVYLGDDIPLVSGISDQTANAKMSPNGYAYEWQGDNDPNSWFPGIPSETLTVTRAAGDWSGASPSTTGNPTGKSTQSQIVAGTAVLISATAVDLNTHIIVGPPTDWSIEMPSNLTVPVFGGTAHVSLTTYQSLWQEGKVASPTVALPVNNVNTGDSLIGATYDARTNEITLDTVRASGGSGIVRIKGALVNTNDLGNITVNGGLGHVDVENQTSIPLVVQDIYAGGAVQANGSTSIVDLLDTNTGIQTLYAYQPGQGINVYTGSLSDSMDALRSGTAASHISGSTTQFDPQSGWRLEWQLQATLTRQVTLTGNTISETNWVFTTSDDPNDPWEYYNYTDAKYESADHPDSTLVSEPGDTNQFEETISGSSSGSTFAGYNYFNYNGFVNNGTAANPQDGNKVEATSTHDFHYVDTATLTLTMSVRADNPVGITFAGNDRGLVDITSNTTVHLDGTVTNPNGDTTITVTNGSIVLPTGKSAASGTSTAPILTNNLTLSADGGIGTQSNPIAASLTAGGVLNATSGSAGTFLALGSGALIGSVTAGKSGAYGDVSITAQGSLLQSGTGTNVSGRDITLTTTIGTIGTITNPLVIAAHGTALANGGFSDGLVTVSAPGDIGLTQVGGDLIVNSIVSGTGDVDVNVTSGGIYDARSMTPAQLISGSAAQALWARLGLNGSVSTLTQGTITAFQNQVDTSYRQYWNLMNEGSVSAGTFTLNSVGLGLYRVQAAAALGQPTASDADVQTYANNLYQGLNTFFTQTLGAGYATTAPFNTFNPNYQYTVTSTQQTNLTKNAGWTTSQPQLLRERDSAPAVRHARAAHAAEHLRGKRDPARLGRRRAARRPGPDLALRSPERHAHHHAGGCPRARRSAR